MILKSDITKMEDILKEYQLYKIFLDKVTPQVEEFIVFSFNDWIRIYMMFKTRN